METVQKDENPKFITLSMYETTHDNFCVIAYYVPEKLLCVFNLNKEQIISNGKILWDIGFETELKNPPVKKCENSNIEWKVMGECTLGKNRINELKVILNDKAEIAADFFEKNTKKRFCIVKVNKVVDFEYDKENGKHYIRIESDCLNNKNNKFLVKDLRWKKYWDEVAKKEKVDFEKEKARYIELLNKEEKDLYLIFYMRVFNNGNRIFRYVVGMHWL